ncbi:molecular chaperone DnaJ [Caulobacter sp. Root655]|uniref:J domain-containing protein n=1 Tax=Caulobacter sp. Root655 TaxID=1736578 RepID=UPI0006F424AF|nr:DnaJ domain-containing protein [Caulobacter sp. Root655]KRA59370.1 molecular chaperone DnaJ [Caulobacter sp. Root655]
MFYLLIGAVVVVFLLWGRRKPFLKGDGWRIGAGVTAVVAFAGAAYASIRGAWEPGVVLFVIGLWTAVTARQRPVVRRAGADAKLELSLSEARSILGVGPQATGAEIQAAYTRLIRLAHPDKGGTAGLAAQLNAARDRLLK